MNCDFGTTMLWIGKHLNTKINHVHVDGPKNSLYGSLLLSSSILAQAATIWSSSTTPANASSSDSSAVEVGVKFRASQSGSVTGIRFYKGSGNSGVHVGKLGPARAIACFGDFLGESNSGWQQVDFTRRSLLPLIPPISPRILHRKAITRSMLITSPWLWIIRRCGLSPTAKMVATVSTSTPQPAPFR